MTSEVYHKKRTLSDWLVFGVVALVAVLVIGTSFHSTSKLAEMLGIHPYLAAGLVELLFGTLLLLRGRQRALQLNVPPFLDYGYYAALLLVTSINCWSLSQMHIVWGIVIGIAVSGFMALMEQIMVWYWTKREEPYKPSIQELKRKAMAEIKEEEACQWIEWKRYEASKPSLPLMREARKADEKRAKEEAKGIPVYFLQQQEPIQQIVAEPIEDEKAEKTAEIVPIKRPIGFHMEPQEKPKKSAPRFQANEKARAEALEKAEALYEEFERIPTPKELMQAGLSKHYAGWAREQLEKSRKTE